jgi:hypothetical protein
MSQLFPQRASPLTCSRAPAAVMASNFRESKAVRSRVLLCAGGCSSCGVLLSRHTSVAHVGEAPAREGLAAHDDRDQVRVLLRGPAALAAAHQAGSSPMEVGAQLLPAVGRDDLRARVPTRLDVRVSCLPAGACTWSSWRCSRRRWRPGVWRSRTTVLLCTSWPPWSCLRTQRQQEHTRSSS